MACSPRTRGCSERRSEASRLPGVFPAHAGVLRRTPAAWRMARSVPRARGGAPPRTQSRYCAPTCSPRTRGCSAPRDARARSLQVFPAHAGVLRRAPLQVDRTASVPRARGGAPQASDGRPECRPCSPRTRGCSALCDVLELSPAVFPAHAGVLRHLRTAGRGAACVPRARGGAPTRFGAMPRAMACSPRTRGCSGTGHGPRYRPHVFPAHAGVLRPSAKSPAAPHPCSPRTRGCSAGASRRVLT